MSVRKILAKNRSGEALAVLTLRLGAHSSIEFPREFVPRMALVSETVLTPSDGRLSLPQDTRDVSVIGSLSGEEVFATTLSGEAASYAQWTLLQAVEARHSVPAEVPKSPLEEPVLPPVEEATVPSVEEEPLEASPDLSERFDVVDILSETPVDPIEKARALMGKGAPFTLFDEILPHSRWAKIESEECAYLIGIDEDGDHVRLLYGIPGSRSYPPDEGRLWTFFPTDESEEEGYYLTEDAPR